MKLILIGITLILFSFSALADSKYAIQTSISQNGVLLGSPSLLVEPESEAGVAEEGKYKLSLTASKIKDGMVFVKTNLEVGDEKHAPSMLIDIGKETTLKIGEITFQILLKRI
jgi:hypothetical protein